MPEKKTNILLVDDEAIIIKLLVFALQESHYAVKTASSAFEALVKFSDTPADIVVTDINMPELTGLELIPKLLAFHPKCQIIVMSAYGDIDMAVKAMKLGAIDFLEKPINNQKLRLKIQSAVEKYRLLHELQITNIALEKETEKRKKMYTQLLQAEKLAAIGRLSSSIAHEFNNPLNGIQIVLEGVQKHSTLEEDDNKMVAMALNECDRIRRLIINLKDFHKPSSDKKELLNIHECLDTTLSMCGKELSNYAIRVQKKYGPQLPDILAVPNQLKQVLFNLITNARDAMENGGGTLTVTTELENKQLLIHFCDTGLGIDPKDLPRIFEPFFTTKSAVKDTGLGLSFIYGIIKKHGGTIAVKSVPEKGSTFSITLPIEEK